MLCHLLSHHAELPEYSQVQPYENGRFVLIAPWPSRQNNELGLQYSHCSPMTLRTMLTPEASTRNGCKVASRANGP
jgi:hypothetical protein